MLRRASADTAASHKITSRAATGHDGRIYVVGGSNGGSFDTSAPLSTLEIYDAVSDSWTSGAGVVTPRDSVAAVTGTDGRIYALAVSTP